jgi:hypothetical protein
MDPCTVRPKRVEKRLATNMPRRGREREIGEGGRRERERERERERGARMETEERKCVLRSREKVGI